MFDRLSPRNYAMMGVFALTVFTSASLLFVVQPMVGKLILPHLGGSSSVWTTCMLFFQSILVVGYVYAHFLSKRVEPTRQAWVHLAVVAVASLVGLPLGVPADLLSTDAAPALWLLFALVVGIGLPLFVVSTSAPLFQRWYSYTDHPDAEDPYYLYAASNIGSMVALLGYPFLIEPTIGLDHQRWIWSAGFLFLGALTAVCGWLLARRRAASEEQPAPSTETVAPDPLSWARRARWVGWGFIPSSLMLGVTEYMTTDIASGPLFWVLPLALYLLTFILVFARRPIHLPAFSRSALPLVVLGVLAASRTELDMQWLLGLHLGAFFLVAMYFHGLLAKDRPHKSQLTEFFIWMSVGGAAGGLFNSLLAPALFERPIEYALMLAVAVAAIAPNPERIDDEFRPSWVVPALMAPVGFAYLGLVDFWSLDEPLWLALASVLVVAAFAVGTRYPRLENVACAVIVAAGLHSFYYWPDVIDYERSFYASYAVIERDYDDKTYRKLSHGTTTHGVQWMDEGHDDEPLGYHHTSGPVGQILEKASAERVAVVGLGVGVMAAYANPQREMVFYEIDPAIEKVADEYFTYLDQCGAQCEVKIGDGRRLLEEADDHSFDVIFLDAYNSDSVPTHLLTREAMQTYFDKVDEDGVVVFHISNRYLDVEGVVGSLAEDAGYVSRTQIHKPRRDLSLVYTAGYTVVAREEAHLDAYIDEERWWETGRADVVWTDDFTNIVTVFE